MSICFGARGEIRTLDKRLMVLYVRFELTPIPNLLIRNYLNLLIRNYATYTNTTKAATLPTELHEHFGRDGWTRTNEYELQRLLPYRLATPLFILIPRQLYLLNRLSVVSYCFLFMCFLVYAFFCLCFINSLSFVGANNSIKPLVSPLIVMFLYI